MSAQRLRPDDDLAFTFLRDIVSLYSPSTQESAVAECSVSTMRALGYDAYVDDAGNAVGRLGHGARQVLLLGHIDTAPGIVPVRTERGRLYGRGSVDAKGPFASLVVGAARAGALTGLGVTVVGAVEEEAASSRGAHYVADTMDMPDFVVIGEPSAWDRVTLGYKGRLLADYILEQPVAHTAGQGRSVCEAAVAFWEDLRAWVGAYNAGRDGLYATIDASIRGINSSSDGLRERVEMHLGFRLPLDLEPEVLDEILQGHRGGAVISTHGQASAFRADKRNPLTSAFLASIRAEGGQPSFVTKTGTSDMNILGRLWTCPIVAYGPGDSALDHTPEEHIVIEHYLAAIRVLERVLRRLDEQAR